MRTKKVLFYAFAVVLGGCIPVISLNPFYKTSNLLYNEKFLGIWVDEPNKPKMTWVFSRNDDPNISYNLHVTDDQGREGLFYANLISLKDMYFIDVYPSQVPWEPDEPNKVEYLYNAFFLIPAHAVLKVDAVEPQLIVKMTEVDKLEELLKEDPGAIEYKVIDDRIILTASTEELQEFILKYYKDDRLFPDKITLNRLGANPPKP